MISVVIPVFNEESYLPLCLAALKNQKIDEPVEIIVVNNNCTDSSVEIAMREGVVVVSETTTGVGAARRCGVAVAQGDIVVTIDADTELSSLYLSIVSARLRNNKEVASIGGMFTFYDAPAWKNLLRWLVARPLYWITYALARGKVGPQGNNMAFRRSDYQKTLGFNATLQFAEDMDLMMQLAKFGRVELSFNLPVQTSCRRYMFNWTIVEYTINLFWYLLTGRPWHNRLPAHK